MQAIRKPDPFDLARLILLGAIWGGAFIFISFALQGFGPVSITAWRVALGAMVLILITAAIGHRYPRGWKNWGYITLVGGLNSALPFFLINWGQQFINSAESALLMATGTFWALLLSHFSSRDERINRYRLIGVGTGFVGVLVLVFWDLEPGDPANLPGQLAVILAGCSYATSTVISRRISHLPPVSTAAASLLTACVYLLPIAFVLEDPLTQPVDPRALWSLVYLGVIATALAIVIRFYLIRSTGAVFVSQLGYLVPLFGVLWSALIFANVLNAQTLLALGLILTGIVVTRRGS